LKIDPLKFGRVLTFDEGGRLGDEGRGYDSKGGGEAVLYGLVGSILVAAALFATGRAFRRFRGVDGLGAADPTFAAALAIWISPDLVPWAVVLACLVTLFLLPVLNRFGPHVDGRLPFAPGLGLGFGAILTLQLAYS
jgi:prepilin signal peptidase PulO-like enzyme (type II secretory pathway)